MVVLQRVLGVILAAEGGPRVQLVASGGAFELIPLRFVILDDGDLRVLGEAITALGVALLPGGDELAAAVMGEYADALGVIALAWDHDTWLLSGRLAGRSRRVVLNVSEAGPIIGSPPECWPCFTSALPWPASATRAIETCPGARHISLGARLALCRR